MAEMGKHRQSTYGKRKGPGDEYHNSQGNSPSLHISQKTASAGRHFDSNPRYHRRESSNVQPKTSRSEVFHPSRRCSYQTSVLNRRNYPRGRSLDMGYGPLASTPRRYKDIRDHRYDRTIRDLLDQGWILEQNLQKLLDSLAKLQSDPDEMEWESSNLTYFVPALPSNREATSRTNEGHSGAVVPSFIHAVSRGEKIESQRR